jgi:hypothetical protein
VEPLTQYGAYSDYMYNQSLIDSQTHDAVNAAYNDACAPAITACQAASASAARSAAGSGLLGTAAGAGLGAMACIVAADTCNAGVVEPLLTAAAARAGHSINVYDVRDACSHPPLCYDFSDLEAYMALPDVTAALGVAGRQWTECTTSVHLLLTDDWMQNLEVHIPGVLDAGVRVLIYAGNQDFICNGARRGAMIDCCGLRTVVHMCGADSCIRASACVCACHHPPILRSGGQPAVGGCHGVGGRGGVCGCAADGVERRRARRGRGARRARTHLPQRARRGAHGPHGPGAPHACCARAVPVPACMQSHVRDA